jgi:secreted PhoX family phosphatase
MKRAISAAVVSLIAASALAAEPDFGQGVEKLLKLLAHRFFGFQRPSDAFTGHVSRAPGQEGSDLVVVAKGLKATILTRQAGNLADMFAPWPDSTHPTHLIFCIEGGAEDIGGTVPPENVVAKKNPSVQRVHTTTGEVETILRGMSRCDGIRRTPWDTILATEETGDGAAYEILDPLVTTNHTVTDRTAGTIVDSANAPSTKVAKRTALPTMAWEGLDVTAEGVVVGGDELRPGTGTLDADGGGMFKFVPDVPHGGGSITQLSDSPLVAGSVYAFQASCVSRFEAEDFPQYGQGCEIGQGAWVMVAAADARSQAGASGATGYYRPEDGHFDPLYAGPGYRFCWTNTGDEEAENYGETVCLVDSNPLGTGGTVVDTRNGFHYLADDTGTDATGSGNGKAVAAANRFVEGDTDFTHADNLAFQPITGNVYVIEDHSNGDIWACLRDGADRDLKSDGCVRMLTVKDQSAEPTGFAFTGDGRTAYLSIQHSGDAACTVGTDCQDLDGYPTDDIVKITGFRIPGGRHDH